jgi:peroxiredoxin
MVHAPDELDAAFRRALDLDVSVTEQLRAVSDAARAALPDYSAAIDRLVERLGQYGVGNAAPQAGEPMPSFVLPDESGRLVTLDRLLQQGPVAVTFHRGHWCPYCRINVNALAQAHRDIAARGGQIVAIMPDRQQFIAGFKEQHDVPFPILTDIDNGYALSLNLTIWVGAEMQRVMEERYDMALFQGSSTWMLPIPATFVVGTDGIIRTRLMDPDYRRPLTIADMLAAMWR